MKKDFKEEAKIPEGTQVSIDKGMVIVKGKKGEARRMFVLPKLCIRAENAKIIIEAKKGTKREYKMVRSTAAHILNMLKGVNEPFVYSLKICSSHFPMTVDVKGGVLEVKNLFGEKIPRTLKLKEGVDVKVDGSIIRVESVDKEKAAIVAADIEALTKRCGFDSRVFQDGCYMILKAGREIK